MPVTETLKTAVLAYPPAQTGHAANTEADSLERLLELAQAAEARGVNLFVINDAAHRTVYWEPFTALSYLIARTSAIGLAAAVSTDYNEPYHIGRIMATLDHFSNGRIAWQIVRSASYERPELFGRRVPHEYSEARAAEMIDIVRKLWDSWEDDALVIDKRQGLFMDTAKVHHIDHEGAFFKVRGPNPVPRSPQGQPLLLTVLDDNRSRWGVPEAAAEVAFVAGSTAKDAQWQIAAYERHLAAAGRALEEVRLFVHGSLAGSSVGAAVSGVYYTPRSAEEAALLPVSPRVDGTLREQLDLRRPVSLYTR